MEVILSQDIKGLGKARQVVKVKDGYARNFLLLRGLAVAATAKNLQQLSEVEKKKEQQLEKVKKQAQELASRLENLSVNVIVATNDEDGLYASVTETDIAGALKQEGFEIDSDKVILSEPIKKLGIYEATVKLHPEVQTKIKVWIVKE